MWCGQCKSEQTFNMRGGYTDHLSPPYTEIGTRFGKQIDPRGTVVTVEYACAACGWKRFFLVAFDSSGKYVKKAGQFPEPNVAIDSRVKNVLDGEDEALYTNGRICEAQGYGIGAFAYYRRLLENVITRLLDEIVELVPEKEQGTYLTGVEKVKAEENAADKIRIAKDLLPETLKSQGVNPLATLYDILSIGLHGQSDDKCLERAATIRAVFDALVIQVEADKATSKALAEGTKKLLREKANSFGAQNSIA